MSDEQTVEEAFQWSLKRLLRVEGLLSNHRDDPGGLTMFGITESIAKQHGHRIESLTRADAEYIYRDAYWVPSGAAWIATKSRNLAYEVFEANVNLRYGASGRLLQSAVNLLLPTEHVARYLLKVDGVVGGHTKRALDFMLPQYEKALVNAFNGEQYIYYKERVEDRPRNRSFIRGWCANRLGGEVDD